MNADMTEAMDNLSAEGLQWVAGELAGTLKEARRALEKFAENDSNREPLGQCAELLHSAHGALRMVEVYGAALLAEEMVIVLNALAERKIANQQEGLEALSRAMVQLPTYLDRVAGGGRDIPLILLPLLNDLRAVRGSPLLSESSLFILNANRSHQAPTREGQPDGENVQELARALRPHFQSALLQWLRGDHPELRLEALSDISQKFENAAATTPVFQLWWVIGGVLEAIRDGGLRPSAAIKRLLGQGDRQIKQLALHGESQIAADPPTNLLNNLLFYVGRATSDGTKVQGIKRSFSLAELLEPGERSAQDETLLNAPSVNLMKTVAEAIRQDLAQVKDAIDIFVRTGSENRAELTDQRDALRKIADTLGVLGLDELRQQIATESRRLQSFVDGHEEADSALMRVAGTLISVEGALDEQLVSQIQPRDADQPRASAAEIAKASDQRAVASAVLRECIVNFSRIKEALSHFVEKSDYGAALDPVPVLLKGITAGLLMLEKNPAVHIVEQIAWHIGQLREHGKEHLSDSELDRLADAIVSVEYFMETVRKGRSDPDYMLDNADTCLQALRAQPPAETPAEPDVQAAPTPSAPTTDALPDIRQPVVEDARIHVDPELLELFIEEAKEEIAMLNRNVPRWRSEQSNRELLLGIRRAFHTLKGSGRMVGANLIGEFAWSLEKVLNAFVNQEIEDTAALAEILDAGLKALPELVEQLEVGTPPSADLNGIAARANALAAGETAAVGTEPEGQEEPVSDMPAVVPGSDADESAPVSVQLDPVLYDIFYKETIGHLESINQFVEHALDRPAPHRVEESLHRAWHTLSGSANMAAVEQVVNIAAPMNEYLRAMFNDGGSLGDAALRTMASASEAVATIVRRINTDGAPPDTDGLITEIGDLLGEHEKETAAALDLEHDDVPDELLGGDLGLDTGAEKTVVEPADVASTTTEPPPAGEAPKVVFDPDIAAIFSDEAAELLEANDVALAAWLDDSTQEGRVAELLRHLHTLKGGAGMAGVKSMGDLSHELETLLQKLQTGEQDLDRRCRDVLRDGFDRLHSMQESLAEREMPAQGTDVIAEIRALYQAGEPIVAPLEEIFAGDDASVVADVTGDDAEEEARPEDLPVDEVAAPVEPVEPQSVEDPTQWPIAVSMAPEEQETAEAEPAGATEFAIVPEPTTALPMDEPETVATPATGERRPDYARVEARMLDEMLNNAGEVSIFHSRLEQEMGSIAFNLTELSQTVTRLRTQLRKLDAETEAQILHRHQGDVDEGEDFDPLEMDRYSTIQQLSRALAESVSDLISIQDLLTELTRESEGLLTQQSRVTTELQDALIRTRMLPFSNYIPRLERVVRSAARDAGKPVDLTFSGGSGELDRQVLKRMMGPFEHMLRNAVVHGIEDVDRRRAMGKPETGNIAVNLQREGAEMVIRVIDDGAGLDVESIKRVARERELIDETSTLVGNDALNLILTAGFSTADEVTHAAGRGVGMDVVANEVKLLGGSLQVDSTRGRGTVFTARLPLTMAVTQALLVRCGEEHFAIPLPAVEGIVRVPVCEIEAYLTDPSRRYEYGDQEYRFEHLGRYIGAPAARLDKTEGHAEPVILVRAGEHSTGLLADEMLGSREVVVKAVGPLVSGISGISGATILADGSIVVILDVAALVRRGESIGPAAPAPVDEPDERPLIMVVDDSITVRRVTQRLLERNDMTVIMAKDGVDAVSLLEEQAPDLVLLDIEMPRMDGYEVASHIRNSNHLQSLPIIMVTSRSGDKHRARAFELGVDGYLGKPYQENQLLDAIRPLLAQARGK